VTRNDCSGSNGSPAADELPALTAQERAAFEQALTDAERYFSDAHAYLEQLLSKPDEEGASEELDDVGENVSFALSNAQSLSELLANAPSIDAPKPCVARLHSRVREREESGEDLWYRIEFGATAQIGLYPNVKTVTWGSAVALALVGRRTGDRSVIRAPIPSAIPGSQS
jgi:transcription elongation GreA/GreB family factor